MIPFDSWDGQNNLAGTIEQTKLEQFFGPAAVAFGTYQAAVSASLEVLGTRTHLIPVVLPITAAPDTIAATLRGGGDPLLLDIRPQTLQIDPDALREVLAELKAAVVILTRPGGQDVDPELLELTKELPTILDSRLPPHQRIENDCVCTFNIFDFSAMLGTGALVVHKFDQQIKELKMVRSGLLGLSANLNDALSAYALKRLKLDPCLDERRKAQKQVADKYIELLKEKYVIPFDQSVEWPYFIVRVDNADRVVAHLHSHGIEAVKPVFPLHMLSEINRRWVEKPEYPVAEGLWKKLVALPTHTGIIGKESIIVERLLEVSDG